MDRRLEVIVPPMPGLHHECALSCLTQMNKSQCVHMIIPTAVCKLSVLKQIEGLVFPFFEIQDNMKKIFKGWKSLKDFFKNPKPSFFFKKNQLEFSKNFF